MTGGSRIVAIDAASAESAAAAQSSAETGYEAPPEEQAAWDDAEDAPAPLVRRWPTYLAATLALGAITLWTALFAYVHLADLQGGGSPAQWASWISDWSAPALLVGVLWLLVMRSSRREALRFGETARILSEESARLELRLSTVNRELSLAREFISAQSRDLETLGRLAAERLTENADRLAGLISDNGTRVDTIASVSETALENMEKLRFQLPVIASSAKDITNNIGAAGRTAHGQLEDMIQGFNRLNQFGQACERQVKALREQVDTTLAELNAQSAQIETIAEARFAALTARGEEFRAQLDLHEVEALASVRSRAGALEEELKAMRDQLDGNESESLTSLRARLTAVRDESAAIARALRESESAAIEAWRQAIAQLEGDLRGAATKVEDIDGQVAASARRRLAALAEETEAVDAQLAALDARIAVRRAEQEETSRQLAVHSEAIVTRLAELSARMEEIGTQGSAAESTIAASLDTLAEKLIASREALSGTDVAIAELTDGSVRLLELIRAGVKHSEDDLPAAIAVSEARLAELAEHVRQLRDVVKAAEDHGENLAAHVAASHSGLDTGLARSAELETALAERQAAVESLVKSLESVRRESVVLAGEAQGELAAAIKQLETAASAAVTGIGEMSASAVAALAQRIGDESGEAIDKAMRARAADVAGKLEEVATHAASVSREAAVQLRDQLAKVAELTSHLERRVTQARERAQDQVDNDFARRVALINEGLNSNAIDIARALDTDVTDTAWAAYLKGDRGIFTRRAVRLLDAPEAKAVMQLYEHDRDFREHVSRYIHDFEAMLRQLLSTRDGHALSVTLLSSDVGKLYVALAQAIERLRN